MNAQKDEHKILVARRQQFGLSVLANSTLGQNSI
jgi:hypothetical protein